MDRFVYEKGDLQIGSTQCDFCRFRHETDPLRCDRFPNGKPETVLLDLALCKSLETTSPNDDPLRD